MRTPRALTLVVAAALLAALAGCGDADGRDAAAPPAGEADRRVVLYSGRAEVAIGPLLAAFEEQTGIAVDVHYGDPAELAGRLLAKRGHTPADVFLAPGAAALGVLARRGAFAPLPVRVLGRVPEQYRDAGGRWVGVAGHARALVYDPEQVAAAELPTSVFDLTGPAWRGRLGIVPGSASFRAFVTAIRARHGDAKARAFLTGLAANDVRIREDAGQLVDDVLAGDLVAGLVSHHRVYGKAAAAGTPIDALPARLHFFPGGDSKAVVAVSGVGVLTGANDDPDARTLVDYLLSAEAQTYFADRTFEYPLVDGVPFAPGLPLLDSLSGPQLDLNDVDTLDDTATMIEKAGLA